MLIFEGSRRANIILLNGAKLQINVASTRWSHVSSFSNCGIVFARFLSKIIKLIAQFHNFSIKKIILDNIGEFTSNFF